MRKIVLSIVTCLALCSVSPLYSQKANVATSNVPAWVKPNQIQYNNSRLEKQAEDGYLDVAYIKQVNLLEQTIYYRKTFKIVNEQGIENVSEVSASYDPTYQKLTFHDIHIVRNGQNIDKLKKAKFRTLQQEQDSYLHQYNGNITALLLLEDVRNGDVIEYAYSIKGFNPVFEGRYADFYSTAYGVPYGLLYYRLITDIERPVYIENSNLDYTPTEYKAGKLKEYEWSFTDVPALHSDDNVPSWFDAYPMVMVSEYNDWLNIREWAAKLFPNNIAIEGALQKKIDAIKSAYQINDERAVAALRFVQDEVRYLGIEMGTGTHKPANPNKTFNQRYGDCKDKSYLLVTMLRAMDIEATPVFVNSSSKQTIARWIPSPSVFDHVTVRMTVGGKQYYVDPTITNQRGTLASISYPAYNTGLVLADSTAGLTTINSVEPGMVRVKEVFSIPDMQGTATLKVTTVNTGTFADDARSLFKNNSNYEMQKTFKQFYSGYFTKIKSDSIYYEDDERTGAFTIHEYYTIEDLWTLEKGLKKCGFYGFVINSYLKRPKDKLRTMPMSIYYPAKYYEEVEVNLPETWSISDYDTKVSCNVFRYRGKSTLLGKKLNMVFEFETLKDFVAPGEVDDLLANYKKVDENIGWELTYKGASGSNLSSSSSITPLTADVQRSINIRLAIFFALLVGVIAFVIIRQKRKQSAANDLSVYGREKWR